MSQRKYIKTFESFISEAATQADAISIFRAMVVPKKYPFDPKKGLGTSWSEGSGAGVYGNHNGKDSTHMVVLIGATVAHADVDWDATTEARDDPEYGDREEEIVVRKGAPLTVTSMSEVEYDFFIDSGEIGDEVREVDPRLYQGKQFKA